MKLELILLILPYTVFGYGVDQPGTCEETNKNVKPLTNVTLTTILGPHWDVAEYSDKRLEQFCAHYNFTRVNATVISAHKKYRNKIDGKELSATVYLTSTDKMGRFYVIRQDATGLPLNKYFGYVIYYNGDLGVFYACRDLGTNKHKDEGFVLKRHHKKLTFYEFKIIQAAYQKNGLNPKYVQNMRQCT